MSDTYTGPVNSTTPVNDYATKFITTSAVPNDWLQPGEDDDRWQDDNAQGPCPDGWRVPTGAELTVLKSKISGSVTENRIKVTGVGNNLYLPTATSRGMDGTLIIFFICLNFVSY
ncbi:MAG: fibrobacter succinogenes major paralogous domain-containing protein [Prevotella sp.]|nr:fibrobacter succinogenes major paralogous domain-containing protein [Prevotella sp.]